MRLYFPCRSLGEAQKIASHETPISALLCQDCNMTRLYRKAEHAVAVYAARKQSQVQAVLRFKIDEFVLWQQQRVSGKRIFECTEKGAVWHLKPEALEVLAQAELLPIDVSQPDPRRQKKSRRPAM